MSLASSCLRTADGARPPTLPELRPSFDMLVLKVLALLQDRQKLTQYK